MFTLSKPYVCCIYLDDNGWKKEVNMDKKDFKINQFWDSTFPHTRGFACPHTTQNCHFSLCL